uniref:Uncharacterized protein n=1 Tax=uncultured prokaryote TaxID=198431 RepID=A0A0H5QJV5_9ZZZZ|nr:hypothetical protein [uncultured prokaryote]
MAAHIRVVTRIPYEDDIKRDVSENVWWFFSEDLTVDNDIMASDAIARMQSFWEDTPDGVDHPLGYYMSSVLKRDTDACDILVYDAQGDAGAPPFTTAQFTLGGNHTPNVNMPEEVALCASYWSKNPSLQGNLLPRPRRQGRVYIGPFNTWALANGTSGYARPNPDLTATLVGAISHIADNNADDGGWCVLSRASHQSSVITNGWVDDAWDTQRRRGVDASTRTSWAASF